VRTSSSGALMGCSITARQSELVHSDQAHAFLQLKWQIKVKVPRNRPGGPEGGGGSRGIALLFLDLGIRRGWPVSTTPQPLYPGKDPVPIVQEAGWASGPFWTCAKNLAPTGIRSPDLPARSQSLYRLSYPGPKMACFNN
jgi:hypothetical protein